MVFASEPLPQVLGAPRSRRTNNRTGRTYMTLVRDVDPVPFLAVIPHSFSSRWPSTLVDRTCSSLVSAMWYPLGRRVSLDAVISYLEAQLVTSRVRRRLQLRADCPLKVWRNDHIPLFERCQFLARAARQMAGAARYNADERRLPQR